MWWQGYSGKAPSSLLKQAERNAAAEQPLQCAFLRVNSSASCGTLCGRGGKLIEDAKLTRGEHGLRAAECLQQIEYNAASGTLFMRNDRNLSAVVWGAVQQNDYSGCCFVITANFVCERRLQQLWRICA